MTGFNYHLPTRIVYGWESLEQAGEIASEFKPSRALIVTGPKSMRRHGFLGRLEDSLDCDVVVFDRVEHDPGVDTVDECASIAADCDIVVGLGGGSPLDAGKAAAMLVGNGGSIGDYMDAMVVERKGLPFIAVPSTAGTGSEVSWVSVISHPGRGFKKSVKSVYMAPDAAIVDPGLTLSCPAHITGAAGMDALTHAVESYVSVNANPVTMIFALRAVELIGKNLVSAFRDGSDRSARGSLMLGSLYAGMSFSSAGCGACHGFANAVGVKFDVEHGVINALLLPHVMKFNTPSCRDRMADIAGALGGRTPDDAVEIVSGIVSDIGLPSRLSDIGVGKGDILSIVENSFSGSMKSNPRAGTPENLAKLLESML